MRELYFYPSAKSSSVKELIVSINEQAKKSVKSKKQLEKMYNTLELLQEHGTWNKMGITRYITDYGIWELKIDNVRIFFQPWNGGFVLLHYFIKKTQKTPDREIEKAVKEFKDWEKMKH